MQTESLIDNEEEAQTPNKVLPKAGLNGFDWAFVQGSTLVLRLDFSAINPRLRQYPKRWQQPYQKKRRKNYKLFIFYKYFFIKFESVKFSLVRLRQIPPTVLRNA